MVKENILFEETEGDDTKCSFVSFTLALTLTLILLISTGFGIMVQHLRFPWIVLGGPSLLFVLQSTVIISMLHRKEIFAAAVVSSRG